MKKVRPFRIAYWTICAIVVVLLIMVVRLNGRVYEAEKRLAWTHAAVVIYLTPDENYVRCAMEVQMREDMKDKE